MTKYTNNAQIYTNKRKKGWFVTLLVKSPPPPPVILYVNITLSVYIIYIPILLYLVWLLLLLIIVHQHTLFNCQEISGIENICSLAVSGCKSAAMFCLAWMSSAVFYCFMLSHQTSWMEVSLTRPEDLHRPLFKDTVNSSSWVRKLVNEIHLFNEVLNLHCDIHLENKNPDLTNTLQLMMMYHPIKFGYKTISS